MNKPKVVSLAGKKKPCPLCGKPGDDVYRPFCSKRCADLDLGKWFRGDYLVATEERPSEGDFEDDDDLEDI